MRAPIAARIRFRFMRAPVRVPGATQGAVRWDVWGEFAPVGGGAVGGFAWIGMLPTHKDSVDDVRWLRPDSFGPHRCQFAHGHEFHLIFVHQPSSVVRNEDRRSRTAGLVVGAKDIILAGEARVHSLGIRPFRP